MNHELLFDDGTYPHTGIERSKGILKYDLHLPAQRPQLCSIRSQDIDRLGVSVIEFAAKEDLTRRWLDQAEHASGRSRLAASRFAHQPQGGSPRDIEGDSGYCRNLRLTAAHQSRPEVEGLNQVSNGDRKIR
jgi:hypothetical protein